MKQILSAPSTYLLNNRQYIPTKIYIWGQAARASLKRMYVIRWLHGLVFTVWIILVVGGMGLLWHESLTPGRAGEPPASWPVNSALHGNPAHSTLIIVAHPHCPCTRATISELARIMARCRSHMTAFVLFFKPNTVPEGWAKTDMYYSAARIPGVTVFIDTDGREARLFRAYTSGQAMLYRSDGSLAYSGGITPGRGHEGDSDGKRSIVNTVLLGNSGLRRFPVFGCSIFPESDKERL